MRSYASQSDFDVAEDGRKSAPLHSVESVLTENLEIVAMRQMKSKQTLLLQLQGAQNVDRSRHRYFSSICPSHKPNVDIQLLVLGLQYIRLICFSARVGTIHHT